jgi:hypothetical protein
MTELWIAAALMVAAGVAWLALRRRRAGPEPLIAASVKKLRRGLYQVEMRITNRGGSALVGESLRRVRPRSALLMSPIKQVSTRDGDFQVWADPDGDAPSAKMPVDLVLGPRQPPAGVASLSAEGIIAAWLFLPKEKDLARLNLELSWREEGGRLRRSSFGVTPEL